MRTATGRRARWGRLGSGLLLAFLATSHGVAAQDIHAAAASGDSAGVASLLDAQPDLLEARDLRGRTPLHAAVVGRRKNVVGLLLERGADLEAADEGTGYTAVDFAFFTEAQRGAAELTRLLFSRGAAFDPGAAVRGPVKRLDLAVAFGNLDMVRLLLEAGADPNEPAGYPMKPLALAAATGHTDIVRNLLAAGADPNDRDARGDPPLRRAVERGHIEAVDLLLEAGASPVFAGASTGIGLLHLAALSGHLPVVESLLAAGADVDARDQSGHGALRYALRYGHRAVADCLAAAGAAIEDPEAVDGGSSSLLRRPVANGEAVAWYLANRGWAVRTATRLLVFDAEEFGVTRPTEPSLSNGFLTSAEVGDMDVLAFYTAYHGDVGEPAYIHALEDSLRSVTYVQNAGDRWRGSQRSVYLSPRADTTLSGARVRTVEVTREMTSLGYLVEVDGLVVYYAGFRAEDRDAFAAEVDALAGWTDRVDIAFLPIPEPGEDPGEVKLFIERLRPRFVALLDPGRREPIYPEVAARIAQWGSDAGVLTAGYPGDAFVMPPRR